MTCTELIRYKYKMLKQTYRTSSQKTRHQKLNSYWVMNSLVDKIRPHSRAICPVIKIEKNIYAYIINIL